MMSKIFTIKKGGNHVNYLAATEYFVTASDEAREASHWQGAGAERLGLAGKPVTVEAFENILHGRDPEGNTLTKNANSSKREKLGFDCVNSPPKSVSMLMAFSEPWLRDEIIKASEAANAASMKYLTDGLHIRTGKGGAALEEAGGVVIATFTHMASRALDMDMHHHNALAAMAFRQDGTAGSLDGAEVMAKHQAAGAIYRAELAQRLNALGFTTIEDEKNKFSFRIEGFTEAQEKEFSQSRLKILSWLKKNKLSPSDTRACERAARAARENKSEPKFKHLITLWKARGQEHGITEQTVFGMRKHISQDAAATIKPEEILEQLTEQNSVFERKDLLKAVAIAASKNGGMSLADIEKATDKILHGDAYSLGLHVKKSDRITDELRQNEALKLGDYEPKIKHKGRPPTVLKKRALYTTPASINRDLALANDFKAATQDTRHNRTQEQIDAAKNAYELEMSQKHGKPISMKDEQIACLNHCGTSGRQVLIQGLSGTGKSFTMGAVRAMEEAAGQTVIGTALAGQAAAGLKDGASIEEGGTLASLLIQAQQGKITLDEKTTIIIDEAAMVGASQFRQLQKAAPDSKIIILGDSLQYQNIEAGAWFGGLQDMGFRFAELSDIERQKIDWHREAVLNLKDGRGLEALQAFESHGLITMKDCTKDALEAMALDYTNDKISELDKVMMTSTHADARVVNDEVRRLKIQRGELGASGTWVEFTSKDDKVSYDKEIRVGDRLRFTKNAKTLEIFNGQHGTIEAIRQFKSGDTELTLKHDAGHKITFRLSEYDKLEYGYCGTGMGNQGASKTHGYTFLDPSMLSKQAGYVLASRSKQETKLYMTSADTEDAADALSQLGRAISRDASKDWTLDYLTPEQIKKFTAPEAVEKPEIKIEKQAPVNTVKPVEHKPAMPPAQTMKQAGPRMRM